MKTNLKKPEFSFEDFVGNKHAFNLIKLIIHSGAQDNSKRIGDMVFLGPSGHGKTTMARLISSHTGRVLIEINATVVTDPFQFRSYVVENMSPSGGIIFVDECHALKKSVQTNLLSATQDPRKLHTSVKGEIYRDTIPENYSFIFATTRRGYIIPELMGRLQAVEFQEYSSKEKCEIVVKYMLRQYDINPKMLDASCIVDIANRSRSARHIEKNCDKIILNMKRKGGTLTKEIVEDTFNILGIDKRGLTRLDRKLLKYLSKQTSPVGLETLGDLMNMPKKDVKEEVEPFLLRNNLIARKSRGRRITKRGLKAIGG